MKLIARAIEAILEFVFVHFFSIMALMAGTSYCYRGYMGHGADGVKLFIMGNTLLIVGVLRGFHESVRKH